MSEKETDNQISAEQKVSLRRRFLSLPTLISFSVAAVFLYFVLGRLNLDLAELGKKLRDSDPVFVLLALVVYYVTFPLRGLRWYLLLRYGSRSEGQIQLPSYWRLGSLVLLGWFGNCISWVRLGDPYRAYLVTEYSRVGFSRAMGTIVAERAFDVPIIFVLLIASIAAIWGTHPDSSVMGFVWGGVALVLILAAGLLTMRLLRGSLRRRLPARLRDFYVRFEEGVLGGVRSMPLVIPITVAIWLIEATSLYLVTRALGIDVPFAFAIFSYLGSSLIFSIPLTPGGLGFVDMGMLGLLSLKMSREAALSTTLLVRTITYVSILVVGGMMFGAHHLRHRPGRQGHTASRMSAGPS